MISRISREQEARCAVISSIAKSQEALAGILESIADISAHSEPTARTLAENIRLLTSYQSVMCSMLTGISLNRVKKGYPASPWLDKDIVFRAVKIRKGLLRRQADERKDF